MHSGCAVSKTQPRPEEEAALRSTSSVGPPAAIKGAVDFDGRYSLRGGDAFLDAAAALDLRPGGQTEMSATSAPESVSRSLVRILTD